MKTKLLLVVLLLATSALAQANPATAPPKIDPAKEADIRKLMKLTGVENLSGQMMSNMEPSMKATLTQAFPPGEYRAQLIELFLAKLRTKVSIAVVEAAVPTYDKYFTDDELHQLMAFYETAVGKKTITVMPQLMTELMTNSQQLGQQLGRDSLAEVFDEHPDLKKAMEEAVKSNKEQ